MLLIWLYPASLNAKSIVPLPLAPNTPLVEDVLVVIGDFNDAAAADSVRTIEKYWFSGRTGETILELYREMSFNKSDFNVTVVRVSIDDNAAAATTRFFGNGQPITRDNYYQVGYQGSYVQKIDDQVFAEHGIVATDFDAVQYVLPPPSGDFGNNAARRSVVRSPTAPPALAHEFGHSFRWPRHSFNQTITGWTLPGTHPEAGDRISNMYGNRTLVQDNAVRKDEAGWLVPGVQLLSIQGTDSGRYTLHRLEDESPGHAHPLAIKVPFPHSTTRHYYVNYRQWDGVNGFDSNNNDTPKGDYSHWNERVFLYDDTRPHGLYDFGIDVGETYTAAGIHLDHVGGSGPVEQTDVIISFLEGPATPIGELVPASAVYSEYIQLGESQTFDLFVRNMDGYGDSAPLTDFEVSATHAPEIGVSGLAPDWTLAPGQFFRDRNIVITLHDPLPDGIYPVDIDVTDPDESVHALRLSVVYKVDTTPPTLPIITSAALVNRKNTLYWTESSDLSPVDYIVRRDGQQIGVTTEAFFSDPKSKREHVYSVSARDIRQNQSPWFYALVDNGVLLATDQAPDLAFLPPAPHQVGTGQELILTVIGSDADGDIVDLSTSALPAGAAFTTDPGVTPAIGVFSWTPDFSQVGLHDVTFTATDQNPLGDEFTQRTITIEVLADTDGDGVLDLHDNCILVANGPLASAPGTVCNAQEDGDLDGYGSPCDFDVNNDGGTGINDVLEFSQRMEEVSTDPVFDADCDGAVSINDYLAAIEASNTNAVPGPSGLSCASLCENPEVGCQATGYPCPSPWVGSQ
jgi:hypothetical protein